MSFVSSTACLRVIMEMQIRFTRSRRTDILSIVCSSEYVGHWTRMKLLRLYSPQYVPERPQ